MASAAERGVQSLLASSDKSVQKEMRALIGEIVAQQLLAKSFEPETQREKAVQKRAQEAAFKAQSGLEDLTKRVERLEVSSKKTLRGFEDKLAAMQGELGALQKGLDAAVSSLQAQIKTLQASAESGNLAQAGALTHLRDEMLAAVSKERTRRLKLFSRWNDKHALDVQSINDRLEKELSLLSQRSGREFALQTATLETLRDKLDYALVKRYGFCPDTRGGPGSAEYEYEAESGGEDATPGSAGMPGRDGAREREVPQRPQLRGVFNLCADAAGVVSHLDSRIDALHGRVAHLSLAAQRGDDVLAARRIRLRHVRNDDSSLGSASDSKYGESDED